MVWSYLSDLTTELQFLPHYLFATTLVTFVSFQNPCIYGSLCLECSLCPYPAPPPGQLLFCLISQLNDHFLREVFLGKFYHTFSYHHVLLHSVSPVICNAALPCDSQLMSAFFCILLGAQCLQVLHTCMKKGWTSYTWSMGYKMWHCKSMNSPPPHPPPPEM